MERRTIRVSVAGQQYKVVSSAEEAHVHELAREVDARLKSSGGGVGAGSGQALLLAALSLANDLGEERARRTSMEARARDVLRRAIVRIDGALGDVDEPAGD